MSYLLPAQKRQQIRAAKMTHGRTRGELKARELCMSLKCSGWGGHGHPRHSTHLDGCRNDGSTCLCECHDGATS